MTFDFTYFYVATAAFLVIGIISAIFKSSINKIMDETEEQASGHLSH
ncbi:MAG: hypothetical protein ACOY31_06630 [Bacillota bacterium]